MKRKASSDFQSIKNLLDKYDWEKKKYITREFQDYGYRLAVELDDEKHKALYIKLAKTIDRKILEEARVFVKDAYQVKNKGKLFMWKVKELRSKMWGATCRARQMKFFSRVYHIVKQIPKGKIATYGQIARALGTRDARRVGHALHANKSADVPCHRVVNKDGGLAKNFGFGGWQEQARRLKAEGVKLKANKVNLKKYLYKFQITNF